MNKYIFSLALIVFISYEANGMEEKVSEETKKESSFQEYTYDGPKSVMCSLMSENEIPLLLKKANAQKMREEVDFIVKQITNRETTHLFADVIALYKDSLHPYRPWCGVRSTQRNIESLIQHYKNAKKETGELQLRLEHTANYDSGFCDQNLFAVPIESLFLEIQTQKIAIRKLMAARVALSLLELDELDQKANMVQKKLDEAKAKKSETSTTH